MLMSLLKESTIALVVAMMFKILAISPHPELLNSFLKIILALVCCIVVSS
jgi:hypothetical protein